jgi:pyruvate ferredoxin oxidoreductase beta subunit
MISKMMGKAVIPSAQDMDSSFPPRVQQTGTGVAWDEITSGDVTISFVNQRIRQNERAGKEKGSAKSIGKAVIGIDRRIFAKDPLALSEIFTDQKDVIYICYDSEMYMDDLIKRSLVSLDAHGDSHVLEKDEIRTFITNKTIPAQVWESAFPYIATGCPSFPLDLMEKIKKAMHIPGSAFISVLTPCPTAWLFKPELTAHLGNLAITTGFFPLFEVESGTVGITKRIAQRRPLSDYFAVQQRYIAFPPEYRALMQEVVSEEYEKLLSRTKKRSP